MTRKKENSKKIYTIFICILIASSFAGVGLGKLLLLADEHGGVLQVFEYIGGILTKIAPSMILIVLMLLLLASYVTFAIARKEYKRLKTNPDDEQLFDQVDKLLNYPLIMANTMLIVTVFMMAVEAYLTIYAFDQFGDLGLILIGIDEFVVLFAFVSALLLTHFPVQMMKKLNPEKEGNVFELNFNKKWLNSCDEGQQLLVYKAAYKAYKNTSYLCFALWMITFIGMLATGRGLINVFIVCLIWLFMSITYMCESRRLEGKR